jgi:predicted DNA-binding protein
MIQKGVSLPPETWGRLERAAATIGSTATQLVRQIVLEHLRERDRWAESQAVSPREER